MEGLGLGLVLGSCVLGLGLGLELKVLVNYCRGQNEARKFNQKIIHLFLHFLYNLRPESVRHFFLSSHFLSSIVPAMFTLFPDCFDDLTSYRSALSHYTNRYHLAIGNCQDVCLSPNGCFLLCISYFRVSPWKFYGRNQCKLFFDDRVTLWK